MGARRDIQTILIIGSGPIVIGQACEFDYSGVQAVRALKEEGYKVILVNPNPATVMTTPGIADEIYMEPLTVEHTERIIQRERPDAILSTMGGQTALNLTLDLHAAGVLDRYGVEIIGAHIESIELAEDRGKFKEVVERVGLDSPKSVTFTTQEEAVAFSEDAGFPVVIRPSFTLGGKGGSIAYNLEELKKNANQALRESPNHQALAEESLIGWKEFEMEVMRDRKDNAIVVCSIENIDPMGVHTGDSITIAPIQTLSDREYQRMRTGSIDILREVGVDCGGSNVQFAMDPKTGRMIVIEMNPRVSRSSALASKATGFPIARCSAKLAVGYTLDEVINEITGMSTSCFEPALDYTAVKVPRFELEKFPFGYSALGTQMKSVGEALALGRTAIESINKAIRASETGREGLEPLAESYSPEECETILRSAHPLRIFAIYRKIVEGLHQGVSKEEITESLNKTTGYDHWFLHQFYRLALLEERVSRESLTKELLLEAKEFGLSDKRIARLQNSTDQEISQAREQFAITPTYHLVDTCAGEFAAKTPYFYSTYGETDEGAPIGDNGVIIISSGPNRIGQGLEFDTSCTLASFAYRREGRKTILVNSNPETVSTDFNTSDRLYIEPLTSEHLLGIMEKEQCKNVVVQLGGQTPISMTHALQEGGANIIGTSVASIDAAEDRELFSNLITSLGLQQPRNLMANSKEEALEAANEIGYPLLLRPSFVLGGRNMTIVYHQDELEEFFKNYGDGPILVDQFLEDAFEYDVDALCDGESVYIGGIMQHIEAAGIHSGDSAAVFPPYKATQEMVKRIEQATVTLAQALEVRGFINIQFASKDGELYIIEANPRASRTIPFLVKTSGVNLIDVGIKLWEGKSLKSQGLVTDTMEITLPEGSTSVGFGQGNCICGWAVKEAVFSFDRFTSIDPLLGPEMRSTGEAIGTGATFGEAFAKAQAGSSVNLPTKGRAFISVNKRDRRASIQIAKDLRDLGFEIAATTGTARDLFNNGVLCEVIPKVHEGHPNVVDSIAHNRIDLIINTPMGEYAQKGADDIRTEALIHGVPYTTTISAASAAVEAIKQLQKDSIEVRSIQAPYNPDL